MKKAVLPTCAGLFLFLPAFLFAQVYVEPFDTGIPGNWFTYTESSVDFVYWYGGEVSLFKQTSGDQPLLLGSQVLDLGQYTKMEVDLYGTNLSFTSTTRPYIQLGILWDANDISSFEPIKIVHLTNGTYQVFDIFLGAYTGMGRVAFKMVGEKSHFVGLDNFKLYDNDFEANFPLAVTNLEAIPAAQGVLSMTVNWVNPTLEADGDVLTSLDSVVLYSGNTPIYTVYNPVPGASESENVPLAYPAYYKIKAVPFAQGLAGYERETEVFWAGLDFPAAIQNLTIDLTGDVTTLNWDPPVAGSNAGYFDGIVTEYRITRSDGAFYTVPGTQTSFSETLDISGTLNYKVEGVNTSGVGDGMTSGMVHYDAPSYLYYEDFWLNVVTQSVTQPFQWQSSSTTTSSSWTVYASNFTGTDPGELSFIWASQNPGGGHTVRAISPRINTSGLSSVTIMTDYYIENTNTPFSFFLETSGDDGQTWTEVHEWAVDADILAGELGKVIANSDVGSGQFRFAITFKGNPNDPGFSRWDNFRVINQPAKDLLVVDFNELGTYEPGTLIPLIAEIENNSTIQADCTVKCTVAERFGTGIPFSMTLDAPGMAIGETRIMDFGSWTAMEGEYLVTVEVIYPGGDDNPANDRIERELNILKLSDRQLILMEDFTGTWCTYCPGASLGIEDLKNDGYPIAVIGWHRQDPYETPVVQSIMDQYGVTGFPTMLIDGVFKSIGGNQTQSVAYLYIPDVETRQATRTTAQISVVQAALNGNNYSVTAAVNSLSVIKNPNYQLRAVITESGIDDEWLGIPTVDYAQRYFETAMLDLSDMHDQSSFSFTIDNFVNTNNAELVLYVQDITTNEVINATKISLGATITSSDETERGGKIACYPNPTSGEVIIDFKEVEASGQGMLRLVNAIGQVVLEKAVGVNGLNDRIRLDCHHLDTGIYHVQLTLEHHQLFSEKLVLIR